MSGADRLLLFVAIAGAALLFTSMNVLWPVVPGDVGVDRGAAVETARAFLVDAGFDVTEHEASASISLRAHIIDHLDQALGREQALAIAEEGYPTLLTVVRFKKAGVPGSYSVRMVEDTVVGFARGIDEDAPGGRLAEDRARALVEERLDSMDIDPAEWQPRSAMSVDRTERRDHRFSYSRTVGDDSLGLKERLAVRVGGDTVDLVRRSGVVPSEARRSYKRAAAPKRGLFNVGAMLALVFGFGAFFVFLRELQAGEVRLARAATLAVAVFSMLMAVLAMQTSSFASWDPLEPRWVARLNSLTNALRRDGWQILLLLAVFAAGDALDRRQAQGGGRRRMASLWSLLGGRWTDPDVGKATVRAVGVALAGGAVLAAGTLILHTLGGRSPLQPRSIFFFIENSASPPLAALILALNAALIEETAYRLFGITWLRSLGAPLWAAVLVPALIFGATHATAEFLPLADPWWGRAAVMTGVGLIWGAALIRFDALTLVLAHWFADLVFFQWPRIAAGEPALLVPAGAVLLVPLIPGLVSLTARLRTRSSPNHSTEGRIE